MSPSRCSRGRSSTTAAKGLTSDEADGSFGSKGLVRDRPLEARGTTFRIAYYGKPLFTAEDTTFTGPGKVALWTKADSVTRFDHLQVIPLH